MVAIIYMAGTKYACNERRLGPNMLAIVVTRGNKDACINILLIIETSYGCHRELDMLAISIPKRGI